MSLRNLLVKTFGLRPRPVPCDEPTVSELRARLDELVNRELGVSVTRAYEMLDTGELDGTGIAVELKLARHLLGPTASSAQASPSRVRSARTSRSHHPAPSVVG